MAECVAFTPIYGPVINDPAWDTGYSTGTFLGGDFYYAFSADVNVQGAVAGVNDEDTTDHFSDIDYGFVFAGGRVRIMEGGAYVGPEWTTYNPDDLFIVMRMGTTVHYLRGFVYDYDTAVYYDDSLPGVPLPGTLLWSSSAPSYAPMQVDIALFGIGDSVCLLHSGTSWSEDAALNTASLTGELGFTVVGAGGFGTASGQFVGELPFVGAAASTAIEGVPDGILDFKLDFGDLVRTRASGEITFEGGLDGGRTGVTSVYDDTLYRSSNLNGYIRFSGIVSGEPFIPTGVAGEFPIQVAGASSEFIDIVYDAGIDGQITFDVAGVGTPTGSGLKTGAAWQLGFAIEGIGTPGATAATAGLVGELPFVGKATGGAYPDNKTITSVLDGDIEFAILGVGGAVYANYFNILLPALGDSPLVEEFSVEIMDRIRASMAQQARLVNLVREFIDIATRPRTFSQRAALITEIATAVAETLPDFALTIAEQFDVAGVMDAHVVVQTAEQVLAAGYVQTMTQAVAAVLSAIAVTDSKIDAGTGSSTGATGGGAILDPVGTAGDPMVIQLLGWFRGGSVVGLAYTTDTLGESTVIYNVLGDMVAWQVAAALALLLDAQPDITAVHTGDGIIEISPAGGATTVTL